MNVKVMLSSIRSTEIMLRFKTRDTCSMFINICYFFRTYHTVKWQARMCTKTGDDFMDLNGLTNSLQVGPLQFGIPWSCSTHGPALVYLATSPFPATSTNCPCFATVCLQASVLAENAFSMDISVPLCIFFIIYS